MRLEMLATFGLTAAVACMLVACGDNSNENGQRITSGFFIGETHQGEDLSIAVGSIRAVFFRCAGQAEYQRFNPPEPVAGDGAFAVEVEANGITFVVSGVISDNDRIDGAIAGNSACNGTFVAHRCDPGMQDCGDRDGDLVPDEIDPDANASPTPARTSTPAPTATGGGSTSTPAVTPTPTPTASPNDLCGNGVLDAGEECDHNAIDDTGCFEDVCTCEDFCDDAGGTLSCNADCTLNFSNCTAGGCAF